MVKNIPALSTRSRGRHGPALEKLSLRGEAPHKTKGRGIGQILEQWREETAQRGSFGRNHKTFPVFS